mgnify:CR=1 FL=1
MSIELFNFMEENRDAVVRMLMLARWIKAGRELGVRGTRAAVVLTAGLVQERDAGGQTLEQAMESGYVMVDWGTAFANAHARHFPEIASPTLRMNLGSLAKSKRWAGLGRIFATADRTRGYGDYYHYHRLAAGQLDAVIESDVNILDIAALVVIVREAGGVFTDLEGTQPALDTTSVLAASRSTPLVSRSSRWTSPRAASGSATSTTSWRSTSPRSAGRWPSTARSSNRWPNLPWAVPCRTPDSPKQPRTRSAARAGCCRSTSS